MHHTVLSFVARTLPRELVEGRSVLEVGSFDVNGSIRPLVLAHAPKKYIGIDMRDGPGVDLVLDASFLEENFGCESFDVVVSVEMLEHAHDWQAAINNMKAVVKPGGDLVLATVSYGFPLHDYPSDYWRFEMDDMQEILADFDLVTLEPDGLVPGVFVHAKKPLVSREPVELGKIALHSMLTGKRELSVAPQT